MSLWLATKDVADIYGVTERTIRMKINSGEFRSKETSSDRNRKAYLVDITSLPPELQQEYIRRYSSSEEKSHQPVMTDETSKEYTLGELEQIYGREKMEEYLLEAFGKIDMIERVKSLEYGKKGDEIEKLCEEHGVSIRSVYRWQKQYEKKGLMGLLRKPMEVRGKSTKLTEDEISFIRGFYLHSFQPKASHVYTQYLKKAVKEGWDPVSRATFYREIKRIPKGQLIMGREGERIWNAKCMPKVTRDLSTLKVNEIWVGDGHTLAILTPHNNSLRRFTLSAMLDMRSRAMVGWCIGKHSSSYVIGLAVRHGILPKDDSPIYGLPGFVYIDNGKDYRSKHLNGGTSSTLFDFTLEQEGLFKALGIGTKFTTPYFPWAKPIERQFQTFSSEMSRYITGFCGETIDERPYDLKEKEILVSGLTIEQVAKIVEGYMRVYNNTPHSSLDGKTPLEVYNSAPKYREDMPREEELDILLLKADRVKITDSGIKKFGVWFWDDAMIHHIGEWATVRFDPNRMGEMYVYVNGELCCKAANKELLDMNASEEKIKEWKKKQAKARKEVKEAIQGYGVSAGDARRMVLEDYTDDEEILDIVCGRNKPGRSNSKVIRVNRFTREGKKISGADISGPGVNSSPANDFFARMGEQFFESTK